MVLQELVILGVGCLSRVEHCGILPCLVFGNDGGKEKKRGESFIEADDMFEARSKEFMHFLEGDIESRWRLQLPADSPCGLGARL